MQLDQLAKAAKKVAFVSLPTGGSLSSVAAFISQPIWLNDLLALSAWCSLGVGVVGAAIWAGARCWPSASEASQDIPTDRDLVEIRKFAVKHFGDKVTSIDRMRQWVQQNPRVVEMITKVRRIGRHRLVTIDGYFCVLPVHDRAARDLIEGRRTINDILPSEVCRPSEVPAAIYIGSIACGTEAGKAIALLGLTRSVKRLAHQHRNVSVLARPVTDDGVRLVSAFGLLPLRAGAGEQPMGSLHLERLDVVLRRMKRRP